MSEQDEERLQKIIKTAESISSGQSTSPLELADQQITKDSSTEPAVDAHSELFDPLQALYADNLRLSKKKPQIKFQNVAEFDTALKRRGVWGLQQKPEKAGTNAAGTTKKVPEQAATSTTRRFLPHQMPIKAPADSKQNHRKNLLKWLEKIEGPLKILAAAMKAEKPVRVVVRNEHGVRGHMSGIIVSFDKHWNLLLRDVIEVWWRRKFKYGVNKTCEADNPAQDCSAILQELGITLPSQTVKSVNRKNVEITRKLEQLFIRGEQVVLVNILSKS